MDLKQSNIGEILDSERLMVLNAPERYGVYYTHALDASVFLSKFISSSKSRALVGVHVLCLTFMRSGGMEKVARDWRKTCQEGKRT